MVLERGPHHRREQFLQTGVDQSGQPIVVTNEYTVLGTGMHYVQNGEWKESRPEFEEFADGFLARHGAHHGIISRQLQKTGAIDVLDPDGRRLQATPALLIFRNRVTGDAVELARIVPTEGLLESPSTVIYPHAFDRLDADVLVKWSNRGLECDVVLRETLPDPSKLGLDSELTDFEVLTEFFDTEPSARRSTRVQVGSKETTPKAGQEAVSESFEFGKFSIEGGDASLLKVGSSTPPIDSRVPVRRTFYSEGNRRFLIESIPYGEVSEMLRTLPPAGARWQAPAGTVPGKISVPELARTQAFQHAPWRSKLQWIASSGSRSSHDVATARSSRPGLIMDWPAVLSTANSFTFVSGQTYQVATSVDLGALNGTIIIEPDVVIKYSPNTKITIRPFTYFQMKTELYRPAVFLSKDDNSLGQTVSGSSGNPLNSMADIALEFMDAGTVYDQAAGGGWFVGLNLKHFRIRNAKLGIRISNGYFHKISHGQFVDCGAGISAWTLWNTGLSYLNNLTVVNCLFAKCEAAFESLNSATTVAQFITFDPKVADQPIVRGPNNNSTLYLWNSIVANVATMPAGVVYQQDPNESQSATSLITGLSSTPFQSVGGGNYYQSIQSLGRGGAAPAAIPLFGVPLSRLTVSAPETLAAVSAAITIQTRSGIRSADTTSRGYRYPAIDYFAPGVAVNAALNSGGGVVIAAAGASAFNIGSGGALNFGSPPPMSVLGNSRPTNCLMWFSAAHEQASSGIANSPLSLLQLTGSGNATFQFTEIFSGLQTVRLLISASQGSGKLQMRDTVLHSTTIFQQPYNNYATPKLALNNCLFDRGSLIVNEDYVTINLPQSLECWNNLFLNAAVQFQPCGAATWNIRDNLFSDCSLSQNLNLSYLPICSHNAFKATTALPGSNNKTLTTLDWVNKNNWPFYYPLVDANLNQLNGSGSRTAQLAGLYHYTTDATDPAAVNGGKRLNSTVCIGLHYPAGKFNAASTWADSNNDGVADVFIDSNGDGIPNGAEPAWNSPTDADSDQLSDIQELLLGSDPTKPDSDFDGEDDWHEAHNMLNPNRAPKEDAKLIDRFRFNTTVWTSDLGISPLAPVPSAAQSVESFEGKGINFPATGSTPLMYSLASVPLDLAVGTVRFWYIPEDPIIATDATWRTLIHARGTSGASTYEWILELQPSTRSVSMQATYGTALRQTFLGTLPCAMTPGKDAYEFCFSYTSGTSWLCVNNVRVGSSVIAIPGTTVGLGISQATVNALMACTDRRIAYGGRMTSTTTFDRPAKGLIDDVEWFNCAMSNPFPLDRAATPWGATRQSSDLRLAGGWAKPSATGTSIEINLRRGWEGLISTSPGPTDPYRLERREWGTIGWQPIVLGTRANLVVDSSVTAGKWYEYRLPVTSVNYGNSIWGYAGSTKPAMTSGPGFAIVVAVDATLLTWEAANGPLHLALDAYITAMEGVYGAANVRRINTMRRMGDDTNFDGQLDPKEGPVPMFDETNTSANGAYKNDLALNKGEITTAFTTIPGYSTKEKLVVLVGHVTVPLAGTGAEDGHFVPRQVIFGTPQLWQPAHKGAWACDAWYGDTDGNWTDDDLPPPNSTVPPSTGTGVSCYTYGGPRTDWQSRNVAGDGKWKQDSIPPNSSEVVALERCVGRIDFSKMPGFRTATEAAMSGYLGYQAAEVRMTATYLNKATAYRNGATGSGPEVGQVRLLCGSAVPPAIPCDRFLALALPAIVASSRQYAGALPGSAWEDLFTAFKPITMWGMHGGFGSYNSVEGVNRIARFSDAIANWELQLSTPYTEIWCHSLFTVVSGSFFGDWNHEPEDLSYPPGNAGAPIKMGAGNPQKAILTQAKAGLATFWHLADSTESWLDIGRAAAGFPIGTALADTVARFPKYPCHILSLLGDPTLIAK